MGITLLHTDPSLNAPWTRTIFDSFVDVMLFNPAGSIDVLLSGLAKPEYVGDIKPRRRIMARHTKLKNFIFCLTFCTPYSDNIFDIMSSCQYFLQMRTRTASQFSSFITQKIPNFFEMYAGPMSI